MTDVPAGIPAPTQPIREDVTCTRCGYNLRGLTLDKLCPECATPIARSVHGNLLRYADPDWLNKLRFGAALMLWNLLIGVCLAVAGGIVTAVGLPPVLLSLLSLVAGALGLWAMFLVTTPEPALALTEDPVTLRKVVRTCAVLNLIGTALQQAGSAGGWGSVLLIGAGALLLVGIVGYFGFFVFLRRFALRIPDERVASHTRIVMWGFVGAYAMLIVAGIVAAFMFGATMRVTTGVGGPFGTATVAWPSGAAGAFSALALGVFGCGGGLAAAVFGIWYIVLLSRYHAAFREAATFSRQATTAEAAAAPYPGALSPLPPPPPPSPAPPTAE